MNKYLAYCDGVRIVSDPAKLMSRTLGPDALRSKELDRYSMVTFLCLLKQSDKLIPHYDIS